MKNKEYIDPFEYFLKLYSLKEEKINLLNLNYQSPIQMPKDKLKNLIDSLMIYKFSFGKLIQNKIIEMEINWDTVSEKTKISTERLQQLEKDELYITQMPIHLLANLIKFLKIPLEEIETSIIQTCKNVINTTKNNGGYSLVKAKKDKMKFSTKSVINENSKKHLFENEEVLEKYLKRLSEILNDN